MRSHRGEREILTIQACLTLLLVFVLPVLLAACSTSRTSTTGQERSAELRSLPARTLGLADVNAVAFSPDGKYLAIAATGGLCTHLVDCESWSVVTTLEGHARAYTVAFSPDGAILATGSSDQSVVLWDVKTRHRLRTLQGHAGWVFAVAFSPDGAVLASGSDDGIVMLWEVDTGERLRALRRHDGRVLALAFSPDGATLVSGSLAGEVALWDVARGRRLRTVARTSDDNAVVALAFSPDGRYVYTAYSSNPWSSGLVTRRSIWEARTGEMLSLPGRYSLLGYTMIR